MLPGTSLHVTILGEGVPILFVHGSMGDGEDSWTQQHTLSGQYRLHLVDRRGYGNSPGRPQPYGIAVEAEEIANLMGAGCHLVGHSYGGLLSLLAASKRLQAVRSLTVIEPPVFSVARGHQDVETLIDRLNGAYGPASRLTAEEFRTRFYQAFGVTDELPPLSPRDRKNVDASRSELPPWDAALPLPLLASASFPKLVVSGDWGGPARSDRAIAGRAFAAVCDTLAQKLGAERAVIAGAYHNAQARGDLFNERLTSFLTMVP